MDNEDVLPADLAVVRERFVCWRAEHRVRAWLPEELWQLATELAGRYGVGIVCKTLLLDRKSLKKRMEPESVRPKSKANPAFVEFLPGPAVISSKCTIECESSPGRRMRISLEGRDISELNSFCLALWRGMR
jgi:hypothetical protein